MYCKLFFRSLLFRLTTLVYRCVLFFCPCIDKEISFIHKESLIRIQEHLTCLKHPPLFILIAGCFSYEEFIFLEKYYPKAEIIGITWSHNRLRKIFNRQYAGLCGILSALIRKPFFLIQSDLGILPLSRDVNFICANLMAHVHLNLVNLFNEWYSVMADGALLVFSVFGANTLRELKNYLLPDRDENEFFDILGWPRMVFMDIHDYGDCLLQIGFENTVIDRDLLSVEYKDVNILLDDLNKISFILRSQLSIDVCENNTELAALLRRKLEVYFNDHETMTVNFEVIFGRAFRPALDNRECLLRPIKFV